MAKETKTEEQPAAPATKSACDDLSESIADVIERQSNEDVKCVRTFGDNYRCNWWVRERPANWLSSTTGKISRSRFLKVTKAADGELIIEGMDRKA